MNPTTSLLRMTMLMIAFAGCRVGVYVGTIRGKGTTTAASTGGVGGTNVPASVSAGDWELTGDVPLGKFIFMSMVGGGSLRIRQQVTENADRDIHLGGGVGYELVRAEPLRLSAFGAALFGVTYDNDAELSTSYLAGLQGDLVADGMFAVSVRLAYARLEGAVASGNYAFAGDAVLFQIGAWAGTKR